MNRLLSILLLLVFATLNTGCRQIIYKAYGIKKPKVEEEASINRKAHRLGLDTGNIVTVHSRYFLQHLAHKSLPDAVIFDRQGRSIDYRQSDSACNAGLFGFIPALKNDTVYPLRDSLTLSQLMLQLRDGQGNELPALPDADYYVFITWTVWIGRLNKDHVKVWEKLAKENKNCRIHVLKQNLDLQQYWEATEREKIIRAIDRKK